MKYSIRIIYNDLSFITLIVYENLKFILHYHLQIGTVRGTIGVRGDSVPPRVVLVLWKEIASKTLLKLLQEPAPDNRHRRNLAIWVIVVS